MTPVTPAAALPLAAHPPLSAHSPSAAHPIAVHPSSDVHPSTAVSPPIVGRWGARGGTARTLAQAFGIVVAFWWLATGLVIAAQRDPATRLGAAVVAGAMALLGLRLVARSRTDATPAGARRALAGAGLLWTWVAVSLYAGWLVGPTPIRPSADTPLLAEAGFAIHALLWHELGSLVVLALAWWLTRGGPNRVGFHVLAVFWTTTQLAKLNVFAGVANPGERFLPEWLSFVQWYVGPARNTPLLAVSIVVLAAAAWIAGRRAARATDPFARWAGAMVACMLALGALEHAFLGIARDVPLWDAFLQARGR